MEIPQELMLTDEMYLLLLLKILIALLVVVTTNNCIASLVIWAFQLMKSFVGHCSLGLYSKLSQRCFNDCVTSFYRKTLGKQEEICVRRCTEKFLRLSTRVATRFAELNQDGSRQ
ncbi:hypothetical protein SASPL_119757 [Salvia splendens]|uniref:Mitochondrial import inner membrane translocase subunit n=1 Tax=Salvia splendens TaxID=180675 RepID=A0A8X8XT91_SALSN|nr:hypothetical protein SASPL_119757 [Salvia splendens]